MGQSWALGPGGMGVEAGTVCAAFQKGLSVLANVSVDGWLALVPAPLSWKGPCGKGAETVPDHSWWQRAFQRRHFHAAFLALRLLRQISSLWCLLP